MKQLDGCWTLASSNPPKPIFYAFVLIGSYRMWVDYHTLEHGGDLLLLTYSINLGPDGEVSGKCGASTTIYGGNIMLSCSSTCKIWTESLLGKPAPHGFLVLYFCLLNKCASLMSCQNCEIITSIWKGGICPHSLKIGMIDALGFETLRLVFNHFCLVWPKIWEYSFSLDFNVMLHPSIDGIRVEFSWCLPLLAKLWG